jgi:4-hydroxythreonine-4-phosphate dehydrogenase
MSPRSTTRLPALAISLGDPAGVGPEVSLRAALSPLRRRCRPLLIGDPELARERARGIGITEPIEPVTLEDLLRDGVPRRGALPILSPGRPGAKLLSASDRRPGRPSRGGAKVAYESVRAAVHLAREGVVAGLCTAPVSKEWFARAGVARTGHTEILGALSGAEDVRMMMAVDDLRVVLATIHLALKSVPRALTVDGVVRTIEMTADHLRTAWRIARPRIAVAALNPHAGEGGVYGDEEVRVIEPAIRRARRKGIDALGPLPADTLFSALGPKVDAHVAMYHDQGLIPVKQRDVHRAVNVTLGLPFVRTSPDHGTAYTLAGTGRADPGSMCAALELAIRLASGASLAPAKRTRQRATRPARQGSA